MRPDDDEAPTPEPAPAPPPVVERKRRKARRGPPSDKQADPDDPNVVLK